MFRASHYRRRCRQRLHRIYPDFRPHRSPKGLPLPRCKSADLSRQYRQQSLGILLLIGLVCRLQTLVDPDLQN